MQGWLRHGLPVTTEQAAVAWLGRPGSSSGAQIGPLLHGFAVFALAVLTLYSLLWLVAVIMADRKARAGAEHVAERAAEAVAVPTPEVMTTAPTPVLVPIPDQDRSAAAA